MWLQLILLVVSAVISYLLRPQPKVENPAIQKMDNPTAEAGRPVPVVFGTIRVQAPNVLWFGDKHHQQREVGDAGAK